MNDTALFHQYLAQTSPSPITIEIAKAEGVYLYGPQGERWIDFISGICVMNVGHNAPEVVAAIQSQSQQYLHAMVYGEGVQSQQVRFAKRLIQHLEKPLERVYFVNSGAEAVEASLKIAKKYTGRQQLISCYNAYHGSTHGALSVGGNLSSKEGYGPLLPDTKLIRFNNFDDLAHITTKTAAVIIEAIQGAGGVVLPKPGYLQAVRDRCTETGALMILDEIQTGFGRTGHLFAHQGMGFVPDILVLAKALGGGLPIGAFIASTEILSVILQNPVLGHITTFGGNAICCAAGLAAFDKLLNEDLIDTLPAKEALLRKHLQHPAVVELRGMGMLYAVIFKDYATADAIRKEALKRGLLTIGFLNIDNGLRIAPPLVMTEAEMVEACEVFVGAIEAVSPAQ